MKNNAVLADVPAVKNGKILTISYDELMDYGPSVIDALESINTFLKK
jgi:ferrichrome ABC superfamily ATP binding cassette transporter, binding protein